MGSSSADVVICGAGIAGISAAFFLSSQGVRDILLVDERAPLTLTSDKSTEAYRNWWPGPDGAMIGLMNRSIDLLETLAAQSGNVFQLNRRGYVYATAETSQADDFKDIARRAQEQGAGPVRVHDGQPESPPYLPAVAEGYLDQPTGCDLLLDPELIRRHFPYLTRRAVALLHTRRCGWLSGQQLGMYLLHQSKARGTRFLRAKVEALNQDRGRVEGVHILQDGAPSRVNTRFFVNAAGPLLKEVAAMMGLDLPVYCERHLKASIKDSMGVLPRDAPLLIWEDPQHLPWEEADRQLLTETPESRWLLDLFPPGVHARPEGGPNSENILLLWPFERKRVAPTFPIPIPPFFADLVLRGMSTMVPGLRTYFERMPKPIIDGGYYIRTEENRPLAGPLPMEGAYVLGALSGYGIMAACAAGELLAAHITGETLPPYADAFTPQRYDDPDYLKALEHWGPTGQL
jgi:glycine/D-amino acid oxidase-like deaminating enzyme